MPGLGAGGRFGSADAGTGSGVAPSVATSSRSRVAVLSVILAATLTLGLALIPDVGAAAHADPPNLAPAPAQLPADLDAMIPPPPIPHLRSIPARSVTPGADHGLQEFREAVMPSPTGDAFFDDWPADLADRHPGEIIANRDVTRIASVLLKARIGSARQIKVASRDARGLPSFATATILVPPRAWTGPGARPILVNNLPIVALGARCTAGWMLSHGETPDTNSTDIRPPVTQDALARGYAVIVPDHTGPRMAYAEPYVAAHAVLDSIRGAAGVDADDFASGPVAMIGYSGGAIATNATAKLVTSYAPELVPRFVGAAIGGVPADYRVLASSMNANLGTGVFHAAILGIARERPEVLPMANNLARWLSINSVLKNLCTSTMGYFGLTFVPTQVLSTSPDPFHSPVAERIYTITDMAGDAAAMPVYIYHGAQEWWIPASQARSLFDEQCRLGVNATYRDYPGEHMTTVFVAFDDTMHWLEARLAGRPPTDGCPRAPR
jgi:hypothetical protein